MASVRRHLASLGLAVVLCHLVMQILVPAALCCEKASNTGARVEAGECCPAGSHPGKICPMHGKRASQKATAGNCAAEPLVDLHDLFISLSSGGVVPALVAISRPVGSEATPIAAPPAALVVSHVPLGPPPRA